MEYKKPRNVLSMFGRTNIRRCEMQWLRYMQLLLLLVLLSLHSYSSEQQFYLLTPLELETLQKTSADNQLELSNLKENLKKADEQIISYMENYEIMSELLKVQEQNLTDTKQILTEQAIQLQALQQSAEILKKDNETLNQSWNQYKQEVQLQLRNKEVEKWLYMGCGAIVSGVSVYFIKELLK